jgi:putative transcriptional regulator
MSKTSATAITRSAVEELSDGTEQPLPDTSMRARTEAEIAAAAGADPDARSMTAVELQTASRVPRTKTLRRAPGLTQEEFAGRYHIPLGTTSGLGVRCPAD